MADTKLLNKLLETPQKLVKELNTKTPGRLTNLLLTLIDQNYEFTNDQFELFINQASEQIKNKKSFFGTETEIAKKINNYFVNKFTINETHATKIMNGLTNSYYSNNLYILDTLMNKQYIFTVPQIKMLLKYHFSPTMNYNTMNNNTMYIGCRNMNTQVANRLSHPFTNLLKNLKNDYEFEKDHLTILLLVTNNNSHYYFNTSQVDELLNLLFSNVKDIDALFNIIKSNIDCRHNIHKYILTSIINKFGFNDDIVQFIFNEIIYYVPHILLHLMLKGYTPSNENLNQLLKNDTQIFIPILDTHKYEKINLPQTFLNSFKKVDKYQLPPFELFERFNILPNLATLNITCKKGQLPETKILLEKYNIIPEKTTLDISMNSQNLELIQSILHYKLTPDTNTLNILNPGAYKHERTNKILEMLINYGLMITIDDINKFLIQQYTISDLSRFNIPYDEKLYFMCFTNNFFPPEYINNMTINKNVLKLHELCKTSTSTIIIKHIQETQTKLDKYCLSFLMRDGTKLLAIINKYGCKPCEFVMYKNMNHKTLEDWAIKEYKITEFTMLEEYDMKCE